MLCFMIGYLFNFLNTLRPDIAALQQRTGAMSSIGCMPSLEQSSMASAAASAAAAAAARQMSVDAEAIKIVIHDVDDTSPRCVSLRRDPNDKGHRCKYDYKSSRAPNIIMI